MGSPLLFFFLLPGWDTQTSTVRVQIVYTGCSRGKLYSQSIQTNSISCWVSLEGQKGLKTPHAGVCKSLPLLLMLADETTSKAFSRATVHNHSLERKDRPGAPLRASGLVSCGFFPWCGFTEGILNLLPVLPASTVQRAGTGVHQVLVYIGRKSHGFWVMLQGPKGCFLHCFTKPFPKATTLDMLNLRF